jgi:hypothetical protein
LQLCVRGLVHVYKFLEIVATKDDKTKSGSPLYDGNGTLRRNVPRHATSLLENQQKNRRQVDSGYCEGNGGLEKRWSQEVQNMDHTAKWSPTPLHVQTDYNNHQYSGQSKSGGSTPSTISPGGCNGVVGNAASQESYLFENDLKREKERKLYNISSSSNNNNNVHCNGIQSADVSPESDLTPDNLRSEEKFKSLGNIQTYR